MKSRHVTMLRSQGISLASQKTSCAINSSFIARATKDKSDAQSGQPRVPVRGFSSGRRSDNARKRYLALHRWLAGLRGASGKDMTVTTTGGANAILPNATLHRVKLLIVFPKDYFS